MESLGVREVRRLALVRAGLLAPERTGLPSRAGRGDGAARAAAQAIVERFGYLQLDTVSIAGARSHSLVLASRLDGFDASAGETLLQPGRPLFEYWGHEASWLPMDLHPAFEFRRREFRKHPWWGDVVAAHRDVARRLRARIRDEGPLRSIEMEGEGSRGWWNLKAARRVAAALWSSGELAIRERSGFQRTYDLADRVIPESIRARPLSEGDSLELLLLKALDGHGWATTGTLAATWRLIRRRDAVRAALGRLVEKGLVVACALRDDDGAAAGWIRPPDLELAATLGSLRPRRDRGVLLSPFDPALWDRARVRRLFGFDQILEIFKPARKREYGYYCMPVLAGERLVARVDLKAERSAGRLRVLSLRYESTGAAATRDAAEARAVATALERHARGVSLRLDR